MQLPEELDDDDDDRPIDAERENTEEQDGEVLSLALEARSTLREVIFGPTKTWRLMDGKNWERDLPPSLARGVPFAPRRRDSVLDD